MVRNFLGNTAQTETCLVKLFSETEIETLEQKVNDFLKSIASKKYVLSVKYQTTAHDGRVVHSSMVVFIDKIARG
jgi:hypothetical protein